MHVDTTPAIPAWSPELVTGYEQHVASRVRVAQSGTFSCTIAVPPGG